MVVRRAAFVQSTERLEAKVSILAGGRPGLGRLLVFVAWAREARQKHVFWNNRKLARRLI